MTRPTGGSRETAEVQPQKEPLAIAIAVSTALGTWVLLSLGLISALNSRAPFAASAVMGGDAVTALYVARALEPAPTFAQPTPSVDKVAAAQTRARAIAALRAEPINSEALRQLARAAWEGGDEARGAALLRETYGRSSRQQNVSAQLLLLAIQGNNAADVMLYADSLLRTDQKLLETTMPAITAVGNMPESRKLLIAALEQSPSWRKAFLLEYGKSAVTRDAFMDIYFQLRGSPAALTREELRPFLFNLLAENEADKALTIWLGMLPKNGATRPPLLYNGDFALPVNELPFNWTISHSSVASVRFVPAGENSKENYLLIDFSGRRGPFYGVEQALSLLPGPYKLTGEYKSDNFRNAVGLAWRVYCGSKNSQVIAESKSPLTGGGAAWRKFELNFDTPACPVQIVRIEFASRVPSDQLATGGMLFRRLAINQVQ